MNGKSASAFVVSVVQASPVYLDLTATIDKALGLIAQAAAQGAKLIAFPELYFPGYPWFLWMGDPRYVTGFIQTYHQQSMAVDSCAFRRLQQAAAEHQIYLSFSFSETDHSTLYLSQALIDASGSLLEVRRKIKPTCVERTLFGEGDGSDLAVHDTALGRIGQLCCGEHLQPLSRYALHAQDEQIHIAAWPSFSIDGFHALSSEVNVAVSQAYAAEGQCYLLFACAVVSEKEVANYCTTPEMSRVLRSGGGYARIYGPDGRLLTTPLESGQEGIVYASIDLSTISLCKYLYDPAGHYARPDATRLLLNSERRQAVVQVSCGPEVEVIEERCDPPQREIG